MPNTPAQNVTAINAVNWTNTTGAVTGTTVQTLFLDVNGTYALYPSLSSTNTFTGSNTFSGGITANSNISDLSATVAVPASFYTSYYGNPGTAIIHRLNRLYVGEATVASGDIIATGSGMTTPDWLQTLFNPTTSVSQLVTVSTLGGLGITGASRSSDYRTAYGAASGGTQGINGIAYNDDTVTGTPVAVGAYSVGIRAASCSGLTVGIQSVACNAGSVVDITPYSQVNSGCTISVLATPYNTGGGPYTSNISAGIVLGPGGTPGSPPLMRKGIVTLNGSLDPTLGAGGNGVAWEAYVGQSLRWLDSGNTTQAELYGTSGGLVSPETFYMGAGVYLKSGGSVPTPATGSGVLSGDTSTGIYVKGYGSTYDFSVISVIGGPVLRVPTGTQNVQVLGNLAVATGVAVPAGGSSTSAINVSSTANLGLFWGSGAPTVSAAQGSLYIRTDGSSTSTRLYVNTNGSTGWTNVTTAT